MTIRTLAVALAFSWTVLAGDSLPAPDDVQDWSVPFRRVVSALSLLGGGTVRLADGEYHFYSSSATNMRFHVSNHDQPEIRPVFLPFIGVTNVAVVAGWDGDLSPWTTMGRKCRKVMT